MIKYCMYCGTKINEGETKCSNCGADVAEIEENNNNEKIEKKEETVVENIDTNNNNNNIVEKTGTSGLAIASLVCSLGGILVAGIILGIIAISLGVSAKKQIKVNNQKGKGLATAGIVIGIIDIVIVALYLSARFLSLK